MTKKKKQTKPPLTVKIDGTLEEAMKVLIPPPPIFVWKVGFLVTVDYGKPSQVIGTITEVLGDIVEVQTKDNDSIIVSKDRLKKK